MTPKPRFYTTSYSAERSVSEIQKRIELLMKGWTP